MDVLALVAAIVAAIIFLAAALRPTPPLNIALGLAFLTISWIFQCVDLTKTSLHA